MFLLDSYFVRRAPIAVAAVALTIGAAGAATVHRYATSQTAGSEGAQAVLQSDPSGSAFQAEVGGASANTHIRIPFGVLGEYDAAGQVFGIGVAGISTTGYAVAGESLGDQPSVLGYAGGTGPGVEGSVPSSSSANALVGMSFGTGAAVYGESNNAAGAGAEFFHDSTGPALQSVSAGGDGADVFADGNGYGLYAEVDQNGYGIVGDNESTATPGPTAPPFSGAAIVGQSQTGAGMFGLNYSTASPAPGITLADPGMYGLSFSGPGVIGNSVTQSGGIGVLGLASGEGLEAYGYSGNTHPVIAAYDGEGGSDLIGAFGCSATGADGCTADAESFIVQTTSANRSGPNTTTYPASADVQVSGDLYVVGKVYSQCAAYPATSTTTCQGVSGGGLTSGAAVAHSTAGDVSVYGAAQSVRTIEDLGQAQLVGGRAYVRLDPAFARTTQPGAPYMVFVTPEGDSRGVFTTNHTLAGFEVRENAGGRSSMTIDYRIVAKPLGDDSKRFAAVAPRARIAAFNQTAKASRAMRKSLLGRHSLHGRPMLHAGRHIHAAAPLVPLVR